MFQKVNQAFNQPVVHVLDRGYAGAPTIKQMINWRAAFFVALEKGYNLANEKKSTRKAYLLSCSFKAVAEKRVY